MNSQFTKCFKQTLIRLLNRVLSTVFLLTSAFSLILSASVNIYAQSKSVDAAYTQLANSIFNSIQYLGTYHPDYLKLQLKPYSPDASILGLYDSNSRPVAAFSIAPSLPTDREVFHTLASLILKPSNPTISLQHLEILEDAWYWDHKTALNAATFDKLAKPFRRIGNQPYPNDYFAFWKFRILLKKAGGRKQFWKQIQTSPGIIKQLSPEDPLSLEEQYSLLEMIDFKSSPVQEITTSKQWLDCLGTFVHKLSIPGENPNPQSDLFENNSIYPSDADLKRRLSWIKTQLPRVNPLCSNAFRSLGLVIESILAKNSSSVSLYLKQFRQDYALVEGVEARIFASKLE